MEKGNNQHELKRGSAGEHADIRVAPQSAGREAAPVARVLRDEPGAEGPQRAHDRARREPPVPQARGRVEQQPAQRPGVRQAPRGHVLRLRARAAPCQRSG